MTLAGYPTATSCACMILCHLASIDLLGVDVYYGSGLAFH